MERGGHSASEIDVCGEVQALLGDQPLLASLTSASAG